MSEHNNTSPSDSPGSDRSLRAAFHDGISHAVMLGCGENFLPAFGIFLQSSTLQIGLLATLPQFFGAIMQWASALSMDRLRNRRLLVAASAVVQALLWLPIALLPLVFGRGPAVAALLVALAALYYGTAGFIAPVWNSLIGDLVPASVRGRFFGQRSRLTGMSTFSSMLLAGALLHFFEQARLTAIGFFTIFIIGLAARLNSARWVNRYGNPELRIAPDEHFSFWQFLRRSPHSNFARFVFFIGAINFAVSFSSPYFALYMLRDLHFSYLEYTVVVSAATITQFLTIRHWGALSDRFGNKKILNLCGWAIGIVPALWLISTSIAYLLAIQVYAGFVWAGFSLASSNFLFDAVSPPKRARCVAYSGLVTGVCVLAGSLSGAFVAGRLPHSFNLGLFTWTPAFTLPAIFLISGLLRLAISGLFLGKFGEVREVEPIRHRELICRMSHLKPIALITGAVGEYRRGKAGQETGGDRQGHL